MQRNCLSYHNEHNCSQFVIPMQSSSKSDNQITSEIWSLHCIPVSSTRLVIACSAAHALSLAVWSSYRQCMINVLVIDKLARCIEISNISVLAWISGPISWLTVQQPEHLPLFASIVITKMKSFLLFRVHFSSFGRFTTLAVHVNKYTVA